MGERATSGSCYSGRNSVMAALVHLHWVKHDGSVHFGGVTDVYRSFQHVNFYLGDRASCTASLMRNKISRVIAFRQSISGTNEDTKGYTYERYYYFRCIHFQFLKSSFLDLKFLAICLNRISHYIYKGNLISSTKTDPIYDAPNTSNLRRIPIFGRDAHPLFHGLSIPRGHRIFQRWWRGSIAARWHASFSLWLEY